ncbi:MAG: ATP-binding protein [Lachnospiraceae bacterium]|nr:ATP-binding protein [Lachnospiraceae bacterium]
MRYKLETEASVKKLQEVIDFVEGHLEAADCNTKLSMQICLAVEEIFVNIASYAYGDEDGLAIMYLEIFDEPLSVVITFEDSGIPYNPLAAAEPDINAPIDKRRIGGLGIFLAKKMADEMTYRHEGGRNILTFKKLF